MFYSQNKILPARTCKLLSRSLSTKTIKNIIETTPIDTGVCVNGWIRSIRMQKKICFANIADGSNLKGLQAVLSEHHAKKFVGMVYLQLNPR